MGDRGSIARRDFLRYTGVGASALLAGLPAMSAPAAPSRGAAGFTPDVEIELTAVADVIALRPGPATPIWSYRARVLKGNPATVQPMPDSYLGPTLRLVRGQQVRIHFINGLDQPSIVHWHGLHVPETMDGHPRFVVHPGSRFCYEFEVRNRAGTYWYHPHPHAYTAEQMYFGLAGLIVVSDAAEQALALPRGEQDLPIIIQDRILDADNRMHYLPGSGPHGAQDETTDDVTPAMPGFPGVTGFFGDTILINGRADTTFEVGTCAYRLRILNASNSRTYRLAWRDRRPLDVIATDGGLLEEPIRRDYVMLAPAQRIEVWVDFSRDEIGTEPALMSLAFTESANTTHNSTLAPGARFPLCQFRIARETEADLDLPQQLATGDMPQVQDAVNRDHPRIFNITNDRYQWGINRLLK